MFLQIPQVVLWYMHNKFCDKRHEFLKCIHFMPAGHSSRQRVVALDAHSFLICEYNVAASCSFSFELSTECARAMNPTNESKAQKNATMWKVNEDTLEVTVDDAGTPCRFNCKLHPLMDFRTLEPMFRRALAPYSQKLPMAELRVPLDQLAKFALDKTRGFSNLGVPAVLGAPYLKGKNKLPLYAIRWNSHVSIAGSVLRMFGGIMGVSSPLCAERGETYFDDDALRDWAMDPELYTDEHDMLSFRTDLKDFKEPDIFEVL